MPAPHVSLPPIDHVLSPHTGWTRAHWETLADRQLEALVPYATPGLAQYRLPGRASWSGVVSDGLEGFARSFLLASFRIAGARGDVDPRLTERYARGLTTGTDRDSGEAWPELTDCSPQMAEAASIAVALHETRPWIWDRLHTEAQERVVDWLWGFVGRRTWDNHWRLYQVVAEQFLASVGAPHRQDDIDAGLDRLDDWYVGDGWYSDGDGRTFDYHNAWTMHLYPLLWCRMTGGDGGGRGHVYRERLARYLADHPRFFGADGAPVHHGRSLTYRFATTAPVWMGALAGCTPLEPGLTRRLASGAVRHFVERGVPDERGLLPLGWYETFLPMTQPYSGPASPYWASMGFLGLLLPPEHPVWTARELPLPVEESDQYTALPAPGWLLHGTKHDGIVRLVNHGSDHNSPSGPAEDDPHYAKFGYSTATAPEAAPHAWERTVDGHIALVTPDGTASRRHTIVPLHCSGRTAASRYSAQLPGSEEEFPIETTSVLRGPWEIRVHRVLAPTGLTVREGGYAVAAETRPTAERGHGWALARTDSGLTSVVVALHGWDEDTGIAREVEANAFGPHSATPYLRCAAGRPSGSGVYVTLLALTRDSVHPQALRESVSCEVEGHEVRITFPEGDTVSV
ncbi:DUF2264 domain-containing protein [Streptomyces liliifuscus]|uniref:DUF2264 domain-containing protein n=1 Tax=Streptomyces liliifuscus TaxID=2797636 RepID=A0A7T7I213_9ACTN|nr:DUF2264 domain-containing protein [Streptomyces liliifuscus]QQM39518.1 DUF2264 domain-containing protein [Streptomyces liliifuscus]